MPAMNAAKNTRASCQIVIPGRLTRTKRGGPRALYRSSYCRYRFMIRVMISTPSGSADSSMSKRGE
jgi:hypothetical protein